MKKDETPTIGILTVIGTEQQAMMKALDINEKEHRKAPGTGYFWYEKTINNKHSGLVRVQLHALGQPGNIASATEAARIIEGGIQFVLLCGIAAGYKGKVKIGDVVVPRAIVDTTVKMASEGELKHRSMITGPLKGVLQMVAAVKVEEQEWHSLFNQLTPNKPIPPSRRKREYAQYVAVAPNLHEAAILSDNLLLRDPQILIDAAENLHQQVRAIEMEAAGFVHACNTTYPQIPWYIVRGISDFGDNLKNDQFHLLAANAVASYTALFIRDVLDLRIWRSIPRDDTSQNLSPVSALFQLAASETDKGDISKDSDLVKSGYFYNLELFNRLIVEYDISLQTGNEFIRSSEFLNPQYYPERYKRQVGDKLLTLPYQEQIDFVEKPYTKIEIINDPPLHNMRIDLERITLENLNAFQKVTPVKDETELARLVYFRKVDKNKGKNNDKYDKYQFCLERTRYSAQARTNLTLDYPIKYEKRKKEITLRHLDMDADKRLKPLEQSILANTLGVSAVIYYRNVDGVFIFTKFREKQGVFSNILGTHSCVVSSPVNSEKDLIVHLKNQLRKNFQEEVGLDTTIKTMEPLAFSLELIRGGKPQFFFIIEIKESNKFTDKAWREVEKTRHFVENIGADRDLEKKALSVEFVMNLVYAFRYLGRF